MNLKWLYPYRRRQGLGPRAPQCRATSSCYEAAVRAPLTHAGRAVLIGLVAPTAPLVGPAPVASVGVDTHGLVSRAHEWELDALVGV